MNTGRVKQLKDSIVEIDIQIEECERRLKNLRSDREGTMNQLIDLLANKTPVIEG